MENQTELSTLMNNADNNERRRTDTLRKDELHVTMYVDTYNYGGQKYVMT